MNELQQILDDSVTRLFAARVDREFLTAVEDAGFSRELWALAQEQGLTQVLVSESGGGMNAGWADAYVVVRACGRYGVPLPIPETMLGLWLLERAGAPLVDGAIGLLPAPIALAADGSFSGEVPRVPWGRDAAAFVGTTGDGRLAVFDTASVSIREESNLAREPRDTVRFERAHPRGLHALDLPADCVRWLGALLRAAQIAGAAAACLELSVRYTSEREQFGRLLSQFQAIQHQLAELAGGMASVDTIAHTAFTVLDDRGFRPSGRDARFEIAAAKCRASEAVEMLTRISHQVHGAIGFTYEYALQFLTRRLWSWRAEFGAHGEWGEVLGRMAVEQGGDRLWACLTH
ncbi:MAG TPA: acyl-CoA dehydrogenase [Gammaproteobacteria bacterium]|nr:acyl-CoA dehydrogenase [Gammaproteobacteria bacterium]